MKPVLVELRAGPFDGDTGELIGDAPLIPQRLWASPWELNPNHVTWHDRPPGEPYERSEEDERGVLIYVYADLEDADALRAREVALA